MKAPYFDASLSAEKRVLLPRMNLDEKKFTELLFYVAQRSADDQWFGARRLS